MELFASRRLLTVANPKLDRGVRLGYLTGGLHLAPASLASMDGLRVNVCPMASAACRAACLNTAGRGGLGLDADGLNVIQRARIRRTRWFFTDRPTFMRVLVRDIERLERSAAQRGLKPVVRLNVLSDLRWELVPCVRGGRTYRNVFRAFPRVRFYDYTKIPNRKVAHLRNYSLTFSLSECNEAHAERALEQGLNVAVVLRDPERPGRKSLPLPRTWRGRPLVNGDAHDLRFLDRRRGAYVGLRAKGRAVYDKTGFVKDLAA